MNKKQKRKIGIIGLGMVGGAIQRYFEKKPNYRLFLYDKYKNIGSIEVVNQADYIYICVPTPYKKGIGCDTSIVEKVISQLDKKKEFIIIIKSTIIPGTTDRLQKKFPRYKILFNPEFLTAETADNDFSYPDRQIIGYTKRSYSVAKEILLQLPLAPFERIVPAFIAEFAKYYGNTWFSRKVAMNNEMYDVFKAFGGTDEEFISLIDCVSADKRIDRTHLKIWHKGKRGYGGACLTPDTLVYVKNSVKKAKDIEIGDEVLSMDGTYRKVKNVFVRKIKESVYKIRGQGLEPFVLTREHPVLAVLTNRHFYGTKRKLSNYRKNDYELEWIDAENLSKGDFIVLPRVKNLKNNSLINSDIMRLFGYYVAEGFVSKTKNRVNFTFHKKEKDLHKDVEKIIKNYFKTPVSFQERCNSKGFIVRTSSKELKDLLIKNCGKYSWKKKLSDLIMFSSDEGIKEFLKGFFRGDGSKSTGIYSMTTVSRDLYYQLKLILLRLGIGFTTSIINGRVDKKGIKHRMSYTIRIRNYNEIKKFNKIIGEKIEKDLKFSRKTSWVNENYYFFPIKEITKENYSGEVFNFEIEGNSTFVVVDGIVHNCLPKDTKAFLHLARQLKVKMPLLEATDKYNDKLIESQGLDPLNTDKGRIKKVKKA